jgi:hypothetical protein
MTFQDPNGRNRSWAHMCIAFAVRLGYPVAAAESHWRVRHRIQDFTHRNRFAQREAQ